MGDHLATIIVSGVDPGFFMEGVHHQEMTSTSSHIFLSCRILLILENRRSVGG